MKVDPRHPVQTAPTRSRRKDARNTELSFEKLLEAELDGMDPAQESPPSSPGDPGKQRESSLTSALSRLERMLARLGDDPDHPPDPEALGELRLRIRRLRDAASDAKAERLAADAESLLAVEAERLRRMRNGLNG